MPADVFANRPMDVETVQYCVNDVVHLPDLHALYLRRIADDWLDKATTESARRVAEAHSSKYDPQAPTKKLGPWGSGNEKHFMTLDQCLEGWNEWRLEDLEEDILGYDEDVGYYDHEDDDSGMNAADGAICPEAFDSCWDKSG